MINRQKIVGWLLIVMSIIYIVYFLKVRVLTAGPLVQNNEWFQFIVSIATLIIGTANVRIAAIRERNRSTVGKNQAHDR